MAARFPDTMEDRTERRLLPDPVGASTQRNFWSDAIQDMTREKVWSWPGYHDEYWPGTGAS